MGFLKAKSLFDAKHITAEIADSSNRLHFVPIKHTLGDYFLTILDNQIYAFRIEGSRILEYREFGMTNYRILRYDTSHYMPISSDYTELTQILEKNNLPRINKKTFKLLKIIGKYEKQNSDWKPIDIKDAIERITEEFEKYPEEVQNLTLYLKHLNLERIVTPVRKMTEFIEDDLIATNSNFFGNVLTQALATDLEHKKTTNQPIGNKKPFLKLMAVAMLGFIVLAFGYMAYTEGWFSGITGLIPDLSGFQGINTGPPVPSQSIMEQYPDPEELKRLIQSGQVNYNDLPPEVQNLLD